MTTKLGINGFGRIGRNVFRSAIKSFSDIEIVGINDLLEPDYLAYMLKYDSVHGRFDGEVSIDGNTLIVNGKKIRLTQERDPANLNPHEPGMNLTKREFLQVLGAGTMAGMALGRGLCPGRRQRRVDGQQRAGQVAG